jgi:hypothetical protein
VCEAEAPRAGAPQPRRSIVTVERASDPQDFIHQVQAFFVEQGFGNVELLDGWDGKELDELSNLLTEEEFQLLIDYFEPAEQMD